MWDKIHSPKGEYNRDHVDLLLLLKHWPIVYAADMACDIVAYMEVREPKLASEMWGGGGGGGRRGCLEKIILHGTEF